jgi:RNA polymerase sigma factor (sigma-70 family)
MATVLVVMRSHQRDQRAAETAAAAAAARDKLIVENMDLVTANLHSITCRVWARRFDEKDLIAAGHLKMVELAALYDPSRGSSFKTFARKAIRGAMWELVRRRNWRESSHASMTRGDTKDDAGGPAFDVADERHMPAEVLESNRRNALAREAMTVLSARERTVVSRYYNEEGDLGQIGASIGISASMASLVHRQGLAKMQRYFALRGRRAA